MRPLCSVMRRHSQRGSAVLETGLITIPLLILTLGTFEIARAAWTFDTLNNSIKRAARYSAVHGEDCVRRSAGCQTTIADIATVVKTNGIGLDPSKLRLVFAIGGSSVECESLSACLANATSWPASPDNAVGSPLTITATYSFQFLIPNVFSGVRKGSFIEASKATETIQF